MESLSSICDFWNYRAGKIELTLNFITPIFKASGIIASRVYLNSKRNMICNIIKAKDINSGFIARSC